MQFWKVFVYNVESRFLFLSNVSINLKATSLSYGQWIFGQSLPENIFNILTMNVIWLLNTMSKYIFTDPCKFSCNLVNEWKMTISFSYYPQNQYKLYLTSLRLDWTNFLNRIFTHITELRAKERTNNLVAIWKLNVWCVDAHMSVEHFTRSCKKWVVTSLILTFIFIFNHELWSLHILWGLKQMT